MIFFGEVSLHNAIREYLEHYHTGRNHQGLENRLIEPTDEPPPDGVIHRRERLAGCSSTTAEWPREAANRALAEFIDHTICREAVVHWKNLVRTNREVTADWFRVIGEYILAMLESNDLSNLDSVDTEAHLVYCIHHLGQQCDPVAPDPREELWLPCPIWFEGWEGSGDAPFSANHPDWHADIICDELLEHLQSEPEAGFDIAWDGQPTRLRVRDPNSCGKWGIVPVESSRGRWFLREHGGDLIIRALRHSLSSQAASVHHRIKNSSDELVEVNYARLSEDLQALRNLVLPLAIGNCSEDERQAFGETIDRLGIRLNDGRVERLEVAESERVWMANVWEDIEWARRYYEMTNGNSSELWEVFSDRHATKFVRHPGDVHLTEHVAHASEVAGVADSESDSTPSKRWSSGRVDGFTDGFTILEVIQCQCMIDRTLLGLSQRKWAERLGCSKAGVHGALKSLKDWGK